MKNLLKHSVDPDGDIPDGMTAYVVDPKRIEAAYVTACQALYNTGDDLKFKSPEELLAILVGILAATETFSVMGVKYNKDTAETGYQNSMDRFTNLLPVAVTFSQNMRMQFEMDMAKGETRQ